MKPHLQQNLDCIEFMCQLLFQKLKKRGIFYHLLKLDSCHVNSRYEVLCLGTGSLLRQRPPISWLLGSWADDRQKQWTGQEKARKKTRKTQKTRSFELTPASFSLARFLMWMTAQFLTLPPTIPDFSSSYPFPFPKKIVWSRHKQNDKTIVSPANSTIALLAAFFFYSCK